MGWRLGTLGTLFWVQKTRRPERGEFWLGIIVCGAGHSQGLAGRRLCRKVPFMPAPATPLLLALTKYGEYHRDRRNVATHIVGIPMIVLAVELLLSRPVFGLAGGTMTPAMLLSVAAALFYLKLDPEPERSRSKIIAKIILVAVIIASIMGFIALF